MNVGEYIQINQCRWKYYLAFALKLTVFPSPNAKLLSYQLITHQATALLDLILSENL